MKFGNRIKDFENPFKSPVIEINTPIDIFVPLLNIVEVHRPKYIKKVVN